MFDFTKTKKYKKQFIEDVMFLYDEERLPLSQIAYTMDCSIDEVNDIICTEIAKFVVEVV